MADPSSATGPVDDGVVSWLLAGDAAVRWQALRDLAGAPESAWMREQRRVAETGWGAALVAAQGADGHWGGGFYRPKWTCTHYTLQLLWQLGLPGDLPAARTVVERYLEAAIGPDGGVSYWPEDKQSETCITGMALGQIGWFGGAADQRTDGIVLHLLGEQMDDGGWNCRRRRGATHASLHTTISVLEGLSEYAERGGRHTAAASDAAANGRTFLLQHRLFRSHRTGAIVSAEMTRFHPLPHWHYDVLRALDYLRSVAAERDERMIDAIELLRSRRQVDGTWHTPAAYPGAVHFVLERPGEPGRLNTLRALRVLRWWERDAASAELG